jgi:hypothetical protein
VRGVGEKTRKQKKRNPKKASKKSERQNRKVRGRSPASQVPTVPSRISNVPVVATTVRPPQIVDPSLLTPIVSIAIGSISGDTTIGDLIVSFPRTREVLMKHGLRFDVEEAGYLYMTLNVFSAINGLTTGSLVQELHIASREPPPPPNPQQLKPIATIPTP